MIELVRDLRVINVLAKFENDPWKIMDVRVLTGLVCPAARPLGVRQYPGALKGCGVTKVRRPWQKSNQFWRWSACINIPDFMPFFPRILQKMPGKYTFDPFQQVKIAPKSTDHKDTSACQIAGHSFNASSTKCIENTQIWPISISQICAKLMKINRPWPLSNHCWRWLGYKCMTNFRPFLPCIQYKIPRNHKFLPFH